MVLESRGGAHEQIVSEIYHRVFQVRFARLRRHVTPAQSYYYHSTQNLMRIKVFYTEFFRKFFAKLLWLQPTNGQFYNDPKRTCK